MITKSLVVSYGLLAATGYGYAYLFTVADEGRCRGCYMEIKNILLLCAALFNQVLAILWVVQLALSFRSRPLALMPLWKRITITQICLLGIRLSKAWMIIWSLINIADALIQRSITAVHGVWLLDICMYILTTMHHTKVQQKITEDIDTLESLIHHAAAEV
jgi:hypothetical protein